MGTYANDFQQLLPPWLKDDDSLALARGFGDVKDAITRRLQDAILNRFPTYASPEGLALIGAERQIPRGPTDTDAVYAARLVAAWQLWPFAGTATGLLRALHYAGYPNTYVVTRRGWRQHLDADLNLATVRGAPYTLSLPAAIWNAYALYVLPPYPNVAVPAQSSDEGKAFLQIADQWETAHALLKEVVWLVSGRTWDFYPDGTTWDVQGRSTWDSDLGVTTIWSL